MIDGTDVWDRLTRQYADGLLTKEELVIEIADHLGVDLVELGEYVVPRDLVEEVEHLHERERKPTVRLVGEDGNVFNVIGRVSTALKRAGLREEAEAFKERCFAAGSYGEVLRIVQEYCDVE